MYIRINNRKKKNGVLHNTVKVDAEKSNELIIIKRGGNNDIRKKFHFFVSSEAISNGILLDDADEDADDQNDGSSISSGATSSITTASDDSSNEDAFLDNSCRTLTTSSSFTPTTPTPTPTPTALLLALSPRRSQQIETRLQELKSCIKPKKMVSYCEQVKVMVVPSISDLDDDNLIDTIWYTRKEYHQMKIQYTAYIRTTKNTRIKGKSSERETSESGRNNSHKENLIKDCPRTSLNADILMDDTLTKNDKYKEQESHRNNGTVTAIDRSLSLVIPSGEVPFYSPRMQRREASIIDTPHDDYSMTTTKTIACTAKKFQDQCHHPVEKHQHQDRRSKSTKLNRDELLRAIPPAKTCKKRDITKRKNTTTITKQVEKIDEETIRNWVLQQRKKKAKQQKQ